MSQPRIYTRCPACKNDTLTINKGHLLCTWLECPDPTLIDRSRASDTDLERRFKNCQDLLTDALNLIGAMQPVCTAADNFMNSAGYKEPNYSNPFHKEPSDLATLGLAVANYRDYIAQTKAFNEANSQARRSANG